MQRLKVEFAEKPTQSEPLQKIKSVIESEPKPNIEIKQNPENLLAYK